ncbi:MAG: hypothetical protein GYB67_03945 [Chloroflexi bacterium]|nr:hypothetical protein [Chloroflexota bacterium]
MENAEKQQQTLEERLAPWLDQGEYVIILVLVLMAWTAGFVDLISRTSAEGAAIFGLYSLPYFALIMAYSAGFVVWGWLIATPRGLARLKSAIAFIQRRGWLFGLSLLGFAILVWSMVQFRSAWVQLPLLQVVLLLLTALYVITILVAQPIPGEKMQLWRKVVLGVLVGLVAVEVLLQVGAAAGVSPVQNLSGITVPYGRVYQNQQGYGNGITNQFGWYYPDFRLEPGSRRIILNGDDFIQALQVLPAQHMGVTLEALIAEDQADERPTEVLATGLPGYGPGLYLDVRLYPYLWSTAEPDEIVVFFHLANDFQAASEPTNAIPFYTLSDDGAIVLDDPSMTLRHDLEHVVILGYDPVNPFRTVSSNSLTFNAVDQLVRSTFGIASEVPQVAANLDERSDDALFGAASFMFDPSAGERADTAFAIAAGLLSAYEDRLRDEGVALRLVTIPFFPEPFFATYTGADWGLAVEQYDLLLPERRLAAFAAENDIPFLGMGAYMQNTDTTVETIQTLYFNAGTGYFTPEGHEFYARALHTCFYTPSADAVCEGTAE